MAWPREGVILAEDFWGSGRTQWASGWKAYWEAKVGWISSTSLRTNATPSRQPTGVIRSTNAGSTEGWAACFARAGSSRNPTATLSDAIGAPASRTRQTRPLCVSRRPIIAGMGFRKEHVTQRMGIDEAPDHWRSLKVVVPTAAIERAALQAATLVAPPRTARAWIVPPELLLQFHIAHAPSGCRF